MSMETKSISEILSPVINLTDNIPKIKTSNDLLREKDGKNIYDFFHPLLKEESDNGFSNLSWLSIKQNDVIHYSKQDTSIFVILNGDGVLKFASGPSENISQGDIFMVPADVSCDISTRNGDLKVLLLSQKKALSNSDETSLDDIIEYNNKRLNHLMQLPLVNFLKTPEKISAMQASRFLNCIQVFSDVFQKMIFIRQATCDDKYFSPLFMEHFAEEFGHNTLLKDREDKGIITDPMLNGVLTWFLYQMYILDNVGKAALIHLVWEVIGDKFHALAAPLSEYTHSNYFELHEEHDHSHAEMGIDMLRNQHPQVYENLFELLNTAWDMFDASFERVMQIIQEKVTVEA